MTSDKTRAFRTSVVKMVAVCSSPSSLLLLLQRYVTVLLHESILYPGDVSAG